MIFSRIFQMAALLLARDFPTMVQILSVFNLNSDYIVRMIGLYDF